MRVAVLVSGGGTNLQALLDAKAAGGLPGVEFVYVLASRSKAYALERARAAGIPTGVLRRRDFSSQESFDAAMVSVLAPYKPDYVVLAGYLCKLGQTFL
ncbi:MAG: phosphoribosylglycinamide formyltransferase, partial [Clostridiaceae bacterium]|nr:phosphoribosylglycinamide formyltransferase [Clostridiaceae bacterium]